MVFAASARFSAHRFLVAAMIALRPAAESLRFGLGTGSDASLETAHLLRCASAMRARAAALIFRRLGFGDSGTAEDPPGPTDISERSSTICLSMRRFCSSNPRMAALMISGESFVARSFFSASSDFSVEVGSVMGDNRVPMVASSTSVKILGTTTAVMCGTMNCTQPARFLFRTGAGPISAYCAPCASASAQRLGVELPDPVKRETRITWRGWSQSA
jgi:hypothetical protein